MRQPTTADKLSRAFKKSIFVFSKFFWPPADLIRSYFYLKPPKIHEHIIGELTTTDKLISVIAIPRGWGKTKLISVLYAIWAIFVPQRQKGMKKGVESRRQYVTIYSYSGIKAGQILRDIIFLITRKKFLQFYGGHEMSVKGGRWAPAGGIIEIIIRDPNTNEIVHEAIIEAKGIGEQIIGLSEKDARPDLIILDDIEDPTAAKNKDQVDKLMTKLSEEVLPGVSLGDRWGRLPQVVYIGTLFEVDCMLGRAMTKEWEEDVNVVVLPARSEEKVMGAWTFKQIGIPTGESLWPERMSKEDIARKEAYYIKIGQHFAFRSQYQMDASSIRKTKFETFFFIDKKEARKTDSKDGEPSNLIVTMDMAYTDKNHSDSVGWCVANHLPRACFIVLEGKKERLSVEKVYNRCAGIYDKYGDRVQVIRVESLSWEHTKAYFHERNAREMEAGTIRRPIKILPIKEKRDKAMRINDMVPWVDSGMVKFIEEECQPLINEMKMWTGEEKKGSSTDDAVDAFSRHLHYVKKSQYAPKEEGDYTPVRGRCNAEHFFRNKKIKKKKRIKYWTGGSRYF